MAIYYQASGTNVAYYDIVPTTIFSGGNDTITYAGGSTASIYGSYGSEVLSGGMGNDVIIGGLGNYLFDYDVLKGGGGSNYIGTSGGKYNTIIGTGDLNDTIVLSNDDLSDTVTTGSAGGSYVLVGLDANGDNNVFNLNGNDTLVIESENKYNTVNLGAGNNFIQTAENYTLIQGGTGNNYILAGGQDTVHAGSGNDTIIAINMDPVVGEVGFTEANVLLDGGAGNDLIVGNLGSDTLLGGAGNDTLISAHMTVDAHNQHDFLYGGSGADIFYMDYNANNVDQSMVSFEWDFIGDFKGATGDTLYLPASASTHTYFGTWAGGAYAADYFSNGSAYIAYTTTTVADLQAHTVFA